MIALQGLPTRHWSIMMKEQSNVKFAHLSIENYKQEGILLCPWRKLGIVNPLSVILLDPKVNICQIFQESGVSDAEVSLFTAEVTVSRTRGM
jgi:hypothetical protein